MKCENCKGIKDIWTNSFPSINTTCPDCNGTGKEPGQQSDSDEISKKRALDIIQTEIDKTKSGEYDEKFLRDEIREDFEKEYPLPDHITWRTKQYTHMVETLRTPRYRQFFGEMDGHGLFYDSGCSERLMSNLKIYTTATQKAQAEIDSYKIIFDDCKSDDIPGIVTTKMLGLYLNIYDTIKVDSDRVSDMVIAYKVSAESYQSRIKELEQQIEGWKPLSAKPEELIGNRKM